MKTRTVTERVGEFLGPVDWNYDFLSHFGCTCFRTQEAKQEYCDKHVERLRKIVAEPDAYEVTTYGGWPRCGWGPVVEVGMYDGWPYWRPVPTVAYRTWLGVEHSAFCGITNIRRKGTDDCE